MEPFNASPQALLHSKGLLADENNTHHYRTLWTTLNRCLPFKLLGICRRLAGEHINPEERENYLVVEEDLGVAMRERKRPPSCLDSGVLCIPTTLMWRSSIIAPLIPLDFCRFLAEEKDAGPKGARIFLRGSSRARSRPVRSQCPGQLLQLKPQAAGPYETVEVAELISCGS